MADDLYCDTCEQSVARADTTRAEPMGNLDPHTWQMLCCPNCGNRLKTVFVGDE